MVKVTGTLVWYYYICKREVWLMAREIHPNQEDPFIEIGRIISEESYKREKRGVKIAEMILDVLKVKNGKVIVGEIKKSSKFEKSATMQLCFYLSNLKKLGIEAKGELLFPNEKKKKEVYLTDKIEEELNKTKEEIEEILKFEKPPEVKRIKFCRKCAYEEFCFA
ncbi:MAG TPA: CRISPR-associated protein Cas4 [bacterium]|nr:CRISPR-associated protein Cas4 [bacterium]HPP29784.1 CRISPR-associated protein Cas4 [bacterium]